MKLLQSLALAVAVGVTSLCSLVRGETYIYNTTTVDSETTPVVRAVWRGDEVNSSELSSFERDTTTNTRIDTTSGFGSASFRYEHSGFRHIPDLTLLLPNQRFFAEESSNSHIYLVVPEGLKLGDLEQRLVVRSGLGKEKRVISAKPSEETRLYWAAQQLSEHLEENDSGAPVDGFGFVRGQIDDFFPEARNVYERLLHQGIDMVPGAAGLALELTERGMVWVIDKDEERRVEKLELDFPGRSIVKLPYFQHDGFPVGYTIVGREFDFFFDGESKEPLSVVSPRLSFHINSTDMDRRTALYNLHFQIPVRGYDGGFGVKGDLEEFLGGRWLMNNDKDSNEWDTSWYDIEYGRRSAVWCTKYNSEGKSLCLSLFERPVARHRFGGVEKLGKGFYRVEYVFNGSQVQGVDMLHPRYMSNHNTLLHVRSTNEVAEYLMPNGHASPVPMHVYKRSDKK